MSDNFRYVLILLIAIPLIATFHALVSVSLQGNMTALVLAAVLWILVVGGALIADQRRR